MSYQQPSILTVIPARGGSKGIPGKNLKIIAGKSLLGWSISAAKASRFPSRIVVSTDSPEIAEESLRYGAEVIERPADISGDTASSESALLHALSHLESTELFNPELLVFLQCTSPLTTAEDIDGTIAVLIDQSADSSLSVTDFHYFLWRPSDCGWTGINHEKSVRLRRQDRETQYVETGAVYAMRTLGFRKAKHRFFGNTVAHITPLERLLEIDEPVDLEIAAHLLRPKPFENLNFRAEAIVFDFDGVFTDDKVYVDQNGKESVRCDRGDGLGLDRLKTAGVRLLILSKERNPVVSARAAKLAIDVLQGIDDKVSAMSTYLASNGLALSRTIYVGNDINDIDCMRAVGYSIAPKNAHHTVKLIASCVLDSSGGSGAIREISDFYCSTCS